MELEIYVRFLLALVLVLALIAALTWAARRFGFGGHLVPKSGKTPRLSVVEVKTIDPRRKLVLVRRDDREHLILLGASQDLLLESGIDAPPPTTPGDATSMRRTP